MGGYPGRMTARLILVRHGLTALNAAGRFQGHGDTPLDAVGEAQANALARHLATNLTSPTVHSSDLTRAVQTARPIAQATGGPLTTHASLREIHVGDWEGRAFADLQSEHPERFAGWRSGHPDFRFPGGESFAEVGARLDTHLRRHRPRDGETLVLVSHGVAITALLCRLLDRDFAATWADRSTLHDNTAYSTLDLDPASGTVVHASIARVPHLKGLAPA